MTAYPWKGDVRITVQLATPAVFTLALRIPGWCGGAPAFRGKLKVNGKTVNVAGITKKGYARVRRKWKKGDRLELALPMPIRRIEAHPKVRQDAGRVALQRGPVVYCIEEADNGKDLNAIVLPRDARLSVKFDRGLFGDAPVITAWARRRATGAWKNDLYRASESAMKPAGLKAIPYCMWGNRKQGEMAVWILAR